VRESRSSVKRSGSPHADDRIAAIGQLRADRIDDHVGIEREVVRDLRSSLQSDRSPSNG
jgi:hypothetical protein